MPKPDEFDLKTKARSAFMTAIGPEWRWTDVTATLTPAPGAGPVPVTWRIEHTGGLWFHIEDRQIPLIDQRAAVELLAVALRDGTGFLPTDWGC